MSTKDFSWLKVPSPGHRRQPDRLNISAEHFIGMSGSGYLIGLAISSYEWMAAATLVIVAVFLIPCT